MLLVLLLYVISLISWGAIFFQLLKLIIATSKMKEERPSLVFPLTVASLALFIENLYFGISSFLSLIGNQDAMLSMHEPQNWVIVKLLIAVSGVLLLFDIKSQMKGRK